VNLLSWEVIVCERSSCVKNERAAGDGARHQPNCPLRDNTTLVIYHSSKSAHVSVNEAHLEPEARSTVICSNLTIWYSTLQASTGSAPGFHHIDLGSH